MDRDQISPLLYSKTKAHLIRRIAHHLFGREATEILSGAAGSDAHVRLLALEINLSLEHNKSDLLPTGLTWGKMHRTKPLHPLSPVFPDLAKFLDPPGFAVHGDGDTPLAGSYALHNEFTVTGLSVNRYIHDPSDWTQSRWIVPLGASGHPASPHYADQAEMWSNIEFIPQLWNWQEIALKSKTVQHLEP